MASPTQTGFIIQTPPVLPSHAVQGQTDFQAPLGHVIQSQPNFQTPPTHLIQGQPGSQAFSQQAEFAYRQALIRVFPTKIVIGHTAIQIVLSLIFIALNIALLAQSGLAYLAEVGGGIWTGINSI